MCGIAGIYNLNRQVVPRESISKLIATLCHRGPDSHGIFIDEHVALAHRRLSIIDLSEAAGQPMQCSEKRYYIVYNGEIYNYQELLKELENEGFSFRTSSDTEVLLNAFKAWGTACFAKLSGMFAFAIYDSWSKELILCRDQFGIKPLYYCLSRDALIFGSEMKAILAQGEEAFTIDNQSLAEYTWFGNALGNRTFYSQISEVPAGSYLIYSGTSLNFHKFFSVHNIKKREISESDAISEIRRFLNQAVKRHLLSDVPVGIFLSGGIDSSAITAFAAQHCEKLKTYSVGFDYHESPSELSRARMVAKHFNTEHREIMIRGIDAVRVIEDLVNSHDEPFADAGNIPLYLLCKNLGGEVKVVLQGDGGDEIFGGYSRYNTIGTAKYWKAFRPLLKLASKLQLKSTKFLRFERFIDAISQEKADMRNALLLTMESAASMPLRIFNEKWKKKLECFDPFVRYKEVYQDFQRDLSDLQSMFYTDSLILLKDCFLEKVDRSTMANSIEARVPFLDKDLAEFVMSLPADMKIQQNKQKYLLKKSLRGIVPDYVLDAGKVGFGVPYSPWLRTSLSEYFTAQLDSENVRHFLNRDEINYMRTLHKRNLGNFGFLLWKVLIFCVWLNKVDVKTLRRLK